MFQNSLLGNGSFAHAFSSVGKLALVALLVALIHSAASADVLLYEGFDYAAGSTLGGQGSGTGFGSNVWTDVNGGGAVTGGTIGTGLSYNDGTNDLQTSGGHYSHTRLDGSSSLYRVHRTFDMAAISASNPELTFEDTTTYTPGHHIGKDGSTAWFSFIYQSTWDGSTNGGGARNWGGVSFQDGDANLNGTVDGNAGTFVTLDPDPTDPDFPDEVRTLRAFDGRGDMGGEKNESLNFALTGHNANTATDESGGPLANDPTPTFVLLRMDFRNDPSAPNSTNEYYETWPNTLDQADQVRMWLNPSLSSEPAVGTENVLLDYEGSFGRDDKIYADRFDFKFDGFYVNARADGSVYDEIRMGTTFGDVTPIEGGVGGDTGPGDFAGDGIVEGADLTLLLDNWNKPAEAAWVTDRPSPEGANVAGDELTKLLDNWTNDYTGGSFAAATIPEPSTMAIALLASIGGLAMRRVR